MFLILTVTNTGAESNPKQNVKSHSYSEINISITYQKQLHTPWHVTTTTTVPVATATTVPVAVALPEPIATPTNTVSADPGIITDADRTAWQKVAICETGGNWQMQGSSYSGGVGFANSTWASYGGLDFAPNAGLASMDQQIAIAKKIQPNPPDQNGCSGGW
jgi:Transglycosylase-like domain